MANFNFNKVILGGRLTADPELKTTNNNVTYVNFSVAVNRTFSKNAEEQQVDFINVVAWRQRAEFVSSYFRKGSSVCIVGSLQTRSWTDSNGNKRVTTEVVADEVHFVDSKGEKPFAPNIPSDLMTPAFSTQPDPKFEDIGDDDDLPF